MRSMNQSSNFKIDRAETLFSNREDGGLTCEIVVIRQTICQQLEDSIATQDIMIVLVFISGEDANHTATGHLQ